MSISLAKQRSKQQIKKTNRKSSWLWVLVVAGVVSGVVMQQVTAAWQDPTCDPNTNPDTCNAAAPLNVSAAAQTKNGPLTVTVNTGTNALTVNTGATGSPVALAVNSAGGGYGIDVANNATSGALRITSTGANTAATITQNQSGGTGLAVTVGGSTGGQAITGTSTTSTTGLGVIGLGSAIGVYGSGQTNGVGVQGRGVGTGSGVVGTIDTGGTAPAGYFDGTNSAYALATTSGRVAMTSAIANTPTLGVASTLTGATGPSAIAAENAGSGSPAIYGNGKNSYGVSGNTQDYNYAGVLGCYGSSTNCALLGSGTYAGYFNGPTLVEQTLQVNSIAAADTQQELKPQGQYSDNSFTQFAIATQTNPAAIESSGDYLWVCNRTAAYIVRQVRPSDGKYVGSVTLPANFVCSDMVYDGAYIWVSSDGATTGVVRINVANLTASYYAIAATINGLTFDGGNLWATGFNTNSVYKINTSSGAVSATYAGLAGGGPYGIVHAGGVLYWVNYNPVGGKQYLSKMNIDGTAFGNYQITALQPQRIVFDGDEVWIPSTILNSAAQAPLTGFDVSGLTERHVYNLSEASRDIVFDQNFLWVSAPTGRHLIIVRPLDGTIINTIAANSPSGAGTLERIYFDGHAVWYSMSTDNQIGRYLVPWNDGYSNGNVFLGISLYDAASNTYTCLQSNGTGGVKSAAGLCP